VPQGNTNLQRYGCNWRSGRKFDPEIAAVFQHMPDEIFEELRRAINAQVEPQRGS